jgi:hypothetical protein
MEQQYLVDPVVWDMNPVCFFDLFLQMSGAQVVGMIGFEDYLFSSGINCPRSSPRIFQFRIVLDFFESSDKPVYSLTGYLEIPSNLNDWLLLQRLSYDSSDIPIR